MARYSNVEGRFRDNHELRYSLRALEKFFPQHGHVYLVTDGQRPDRLRPSDRLTLVDHRDLIPEASLPTVDSEHIESWSWDKPTIISDFVLRWALAHEVTSLRPYRHRYVSTDDAQTGDPRLQNRLTVCSRYCPVRHASRAREH